MKYLIIVAVLAAGFFAGNQFGTRGGLSAARREDMLAFLQIYNARMKTNPVPPEVQKHVQYVTKILLCESNFDNKAVGDRGKAHGIAQFHKDTFDRFKKLARSPWLKLSSERDQILLLSWAILNGYSKEWSCAKGK